MEFSTNKIKYFRNKKNISLKKLSEKTNLSAGYLSHLENGGRTNPSFNAMKEIASALNERISDIFNI